MERRASCLVAACLLVAGAGHESGRQPWDGHADVAGSLAGLGAGPAPARSLKTTSGITADHPLLSSAQETGEDLDAVIASLRSEVGEAAPAPAEAASSSERKAEREARRAAKEVGDLLAQPRQTHHGAAETQGGAGEDGGEDSQGAAFGSGVPWPQWPPGPPSLPDIFERGEDLDFGDLEPPREPTWPLTLPEPPSKVDKKRHKKMEDVLIHEAIERLRMKHKEKARQQQQVVQKAPGDWEQTPIDVDDISATLLCSVYNLVWEPVDMTKSVFMENNVSACQRRCATTDGCAHFNYWVSGGHCHLASSFARPTDSRLGWISGPAGCSLNQRSKALVNVALKKKACLKQEAAYFDLDNADQMPTIMDSVPMCQNFCTENGAPLFSFNTLTGMCHCEKEDSQLKREAFMVAGPVKCQPSISFTVHMDGVLWSELRAEPKLLRKFEQEIAKAVAREARGGVVGEKWEAMKAATLAKIKEDESDNPQAQGIGISDENVGVVVTDTADPTVEVLFQPPNSVDSEDVLDTFRASNMKDSIERAVNTIDEIKTVSIRVVSISEYVMEVVDSDDNFSVKYSASRGLPSVAGSARDALGAITLVGALIVAVLVVGHRAFGGQAKAFRRARLDGAAPPASHFAGLGVAASCSENARDTRDVEVVSSAQRVPASRPKVKAAFSRYLPTERDPYAEGLMEREQRDEEAADEEATPRGAFSEEMVRLAGI